MPWYFVSEDQEETLFSSLWVASLTKRLKAKAKALHKNFLAQKPDQNPFKLIRIIAENSSPDGQDREEITALQHIGETAYSWEPQTDDEADDDHPAIKEG